MRISITILLLAIAVASTPTFASPAEDMARLEAEVKMGRALAVDLRNQILGGPLSPADREKFLSELEIERRNFEARYLAARERLETATVQQQVPQIVIAHDSAREDGDARMAESARQAALLRVAELHYEAEARQRGNVVGTKPDTLLQAAMARSSEIQTQWAISEARATADQAKRIAEQARNDAQKEATRAEQAARSATNAAIGAR